MIKVNLLRNRVGEQTTVTQATSVGGGLASGSTVVGQGARAAITKVAVILMFTVGLMIYENNNIRALNEEAARVADQTNTLQQQVAQMSADVESVKDIEGQAKELEDKLKILKLLSRLRLREVKTLDFMQSSIPEKVWLRTIRYDASKEHLDVGHFVFEGGAVTTDELMEFVKRLDNSAYLSDVIVVKNQEVLEAGKTPLRDFLFSAEVEAQN